MSSIYLFRAILHRLQPYRVQRPLACTCPLIGRGLATTIWFIIIWCDEFAENFEEVSKLLYRLHWFVQVHG